MKRKKTRLDKLRIDLTTLKIERSEISIESYDTEAVKNFTENFLTNFDSLWIESDLYIKQALQSTIFPKGITCQNKEIRTTQLSESFQFIQSISDQKFSLVTPQGIEPWLAE